MAAAGRLIRLPLLDREIPLITDEWAKPEVGSGCVKITPGHDPNDYEVWQRHQDRIGLINILEPDGTLNGAAGPYAGPRPLRGAHARGGRPPERRPAGPHRAAPGRDRPLRPLRHRHRAVPVAAVVPAHGRRARRRHRGARHRQRGHRPRAGAGGDRRGGRRLAVADRAQARLLPGRPLRAHLPGLAGREARLEHQPAALVGTPDPDLDRALHGRPAAAGARPRRARQGPRGRGGAAPRGDRRDRPRGRLPHGGRGGRGARVRRGGDRPLPARRGGGARAGGGAGRARLRAGPRRAGHLVLQRAVAAQHPGLARSRRRPGRPRPAPARRRRRRRGLPELLLPRLLPGDRPRHHHPVGGAHGDRRHVQPGRPAVRALLRARQHPGRQGRDDEQVGRQRHRSRRHHRALRRRRPALRDVRAADRQPGHPPAGAGRVAVHGQDHRAGHRRARPDHLHLPVPGHRQGVRRAGHHARPAGGDPDQRPLRRRPLLLHQALERGPLRVHQPARLPPPGAGARRARERGPLDPVAPVAHLRGRAGAALTLPSVGGAGRRARVLLGRPVRLVPGADQAEGVRRRGRGRRCGPPDGGGRAGRHAAAAAPVRALHQRDPVGVPARAGAAPRHRRLAAGRRGAAGGRGLAAAGCAPRGRGAGSRRRPPARRRPRGP